MQNAADGQTAASTLTDKASELARTARSQTMDFASKAADQIKEHSGSLGEGAKEVASEAAGKLISAVDDQKSVGADYISGWAGAVRKAADGFDTEIPQAAHYIRSAAEQIDTVAGAIRERKLGDLVQEVQQFARNQPTAFLGMSLLAGFAAVRFLKSSSTAPAMQTALSSAPGGNGMSGDGHHPASGAGNGFNAPRTN